MNEPLIPLDSSCCVCGVKLSFVGYSMLGEFYCLEHAVVGRKKAENLKKTLSKGNSMKLILTLLIILFTLGCVEAPQEQEPEQTVIEQPTPPIEDPPIDDPPIDDPPIEEPQPDPPLEDPLPAVKLSLFAYSSSGSLFFDGTDWVQTDYEKKSGSQTYMIGDQIHTLDESGNSLSVIQAPEKGDLIKKTSNGFVLCDVMTRAESSANGGMNRVHSQIYINSQGVSSEFGHWSQHQWECSKIIETNSGEIGIKDTAGRFHSLTGNPSVMVANDNGIFIHSRLGNTATVSTSEGDQSIIWVMNYFLKSKDWIELEGTYYSHNGYSYSFVNGFDRVYDSGTLMKDWNSYPYPIPTIYGEAPVLIPIGSGVDSIYWLECNSGTLIEYVPAFDSIISQNSLYIGSGLRSDGNALAKTLKPVLIGENVYFTYLGKVGRLNLVDGSVGIVFNGDYSIEGF